MTVKKATVTSRKTAETAKASDPVKTAAPVKAEEPAKKEAPAKVESAAKETPVKAEKTVAKEAPVKAETEKKTETAAAEVKEEPAKKTAAKKEPAKKTAGKKAVKAEKAEVSRQVYVQFAGKEVSTAALTELVTEKWVALGHRASSIKSMEVYVKPEDMAAYYVINGKETGKLEL